MMTHRQGAYGTDRVTLQHVVDESRERAAILTVHAHPDDEASKGAPTLAKYHALGAHTVLVCCTGGEEGDLQNPSLREAGQPFHGLEPEQERELVASMREAELAASVDIIGFDELVMLGYNTPAVNSQMSDEGLEKRLYHSDLSMTAGAYQNATWVAGIAKAGVEDGHPLIAGSVIVDPNGFVVARAETEGDELRFECASVEPLRGAIPGQSLQHEYRCDKRAPQGQAPVSERCEQLCAQRFTRMPQQL